MQFLQIAGDKRGKIVNETIDSLFPSRYNVLKRLRPEE